MGRYCYRIIGLYFGAQSLCQMSIITMRIQFLHILLFLVLSCYLIDGSRRLSNDICRTVLETTEKLNSADRTIIFRCRPGDNCGGIGDRLGGVMGGAFYALKSERSFRILWPEWEHVFKPGKSNWTFDANVLNIPYEDKNGQEIDKTRVEDVNGNKTYPAFKDRTDIGVVNDLNSRQVTDPLAVPNIEKFKHIFFHSNRGPTRELFDEISAQYKWGDVFPINDYSYAAVYMCIFEGLFRPTEEFLQSSYKAVGHTAVPFSHVIKVLEDPKLSSMSFHHRVDDGTAAANSATDAITAKEIQTIVALRSKHAIEDRKMNLFFVSNSNASSHKILHDDSIKTAFHAVYCQELSAVIHVNSLEGESSSHTQRASAKAIASTLQAMRDWWVMRLSDVLIGEQSGFSKSAALLAPPDQVRYEDGGSAYRPNYWIMCGNRFC